MEKFHAQGYKTPLQVVSYALSLLSAHPEATTQASLSLCAVACAARAISFHRKLPRLHLHPCRSTLIRLRRSSN